MINIIAIDNIRSLSGGSAFGLLIVPIYLLLGVCFFVPVALISAELATGWPKRGGLYVWVKEALGHRWGLWVIFLQWIYNVIWYPTQVMFILTALMYLLGVTIEQPLLYITTTSLMFVAITLINIRGMRFSSVFSNAGAVIGTLVPMMVLVCLAVYWLATGHPAAADLSLASLNPSPEVIKNLSGYLTLVMFGLVGIEMSAVHADEVTEPQKAYPKAILWSMGAILVSLILGTLALSVLLPSAEHDETLGVFKAIAHGFSLIPGASIWTTLLTIMIVFGSIASLAAWIIGPGKGIHAASLDGVAPRWLSPVNQHGVPYRMMWLQVLIFVSLMLLRQTLPPRLLFFILTAMTTQLALVAYIVMFVSAIILRFTHAKTPRHYRVPGGNLGLILLSVLGISSCIIAIITGFVIPSEVIGDSVHISEWSMRGYMLLGLMVVGLAPLSFKRRSKP